MDVRRVNRVTFSCSAAPPHCGGFAARSDRSDRGFRTHRRAGTHSWEPCSLVVDGLECVFREVVDD